MSQKNIEAIYPLSPMQQGMLFHTLYAPQSGLYIEQMLYQLQGALQVSAFQRAWQHVVDRHSILRTLFVWKKLDQPRQVVRSRVALPWHQHDWRGLSSTEQRAHLTTLLEKDQAQSFDLMQAPLMRMTLIQMAEDDYLLIWSYHHLLLDRSSKRLILKEVFACYEAFRQGRPIHLESCSPYRDYIAWLQQQDISQAEAFWRETLNGFFAATPLLGDSGSGLVHDQQAATSECSIQLSETTTSALQHFARQQQLTMNTLVQGAWALLLSRCSSTNDVVFGAVVDGRPSTMPGAESMVGLFINTLPVRVQVPAQVSLLPWLKALQAKQADARQYEYSPLVEIQKWSEVPAGQPLFESLLVFINTQMSNPFQDHESSLLIRESGSEKATYPLTVVAVPGPALQFIIRYRRHRFDPSTVRCLLSYLCTILESMVAHPEERLYALPLLTEDERHHMLVEWNSTTRAYPENQCLHELFEEQVICQPESIAIICADTSLTYGELNRRANQLAHHLRSLRIGPEILVGLCMERSVEMVVGLLGILKAGGAYVPLDPAYPKDRLSFMLADARVSVLLTQQRLVAELPAHQAQVVCLDSSWATIAHECATNPKSGVTPENLVYVIYTSGSTGRPKGILLNHSGRVNNFWDFNQRFAIGPQDRLLALSSLSFDMAAYDVFGTLSAGGIIVLPEASAERDLAHWADLMVQYSISVWHSVPALLQLLLEYVSGHPELVPHTLRLVLLGGDWIPVTLPDQVKSLVADAQVISLGGTTEASMDSTLYPIQACDPAWKSIPYGQPMTNQRCYVLDAQLQPVPIGAVGELHLAGVGLARGYLNCPDLTAQKFIPNPLKEEPGYRLYKTGDLVRYRPDGVLELLGRIDHQIKIRGVRIELGEIEAALRVCPALQEALVMTREDESGRRFLVAYLVPRQHQALDIDELRSTLKERLPDAMVPSAFVILETLPLTPNGKVDRKHLPVPDWTRREQGEVFVPPRTATEKRLASIWAQIFHMEQIGINDNFFALGGDSIMSIRIIARANEAGLQLTPKQLFQHQTIAELASVATVAPEVWEQQGQVMEMVTPSLLLAKLDQQQLDRMRQENPQIEDLYPLSSLQQHMLFHSLATPRSGLYVNQRSFPLPRNLNMAAWERAWQCVVDHHAILRTSFVWEGLQQPLQAVHSTVKIALEQLDVRGLSPIEQHEKVQNFLQAKRAQGFDLAQAPLLHLVVVRVDEDAYHFIQFYSYLLLDGWSVGLLWKDVFTCYEALCQNQDFGLEPGRPYRDYIAWLVQQDLSKAKMFWQQQLRGFIFSPPLMRERTAENVSGNNESYVRQAIRLGTTTTAALQSFAHRRSLTMNTLVQGAWVLLLSCYSGKQDVIFGVTSSGRPTTLAGIESMVGLFINTLPMRVQVSPTTLLLPWLQALQAQQVEIRQYEYSPLQQIYAWCAVPQHLPLFESTLIFENYPIDISLQKVGKSLNTSHALAKRNYTLAQVEVPLRVDIVSGSELELNMFYYRSYFDDPYITQMLDQFRAVLEGIVTDPMQPLSDLMLLVEVVAPVSWQAI